MRKRPGGTIRILAHCARCGNAPRDYAVRKVVAFLPGRHELIVCRGCDDHHAATPTMLEATAMAIEDGDTIADMDFVQEWRAEAGRVRRTAEFFLGTERYTELRAPLIEKRKEVVAEYEQRRNRERVAYGIGDDYEGDDDLVFVGSVLCERCDDPRDDPDDPLCAQCREDDET